jgi:hypothetical protein
VRGLLRPDSAEGPANDLEELGFRLAREPACDRPHVVERDDHRFALLRDARPDPNLAGRVVFVTLAELLGHEIGVFDDESLHGVLLRGRSLRERMREGPLSLPFLSHPARRRAW